VLDSGDEREREEDGDDEHRHDVARLVHGPQRDQRQEDNGDRPQHRADGDDDTGRVLLGGRLFLWRIRRCRRRIRFRIVRAHVLTFLRHPMS